MLEILFFKSFSTNKMPEKASLELQCGCSRSPFNLGRNTLCTKLTRNLILNFKYIRIIAGYGLSYSEVCLYEVKHFHSQDSVKEKFLLQVLINISSLINFRVIKP